MLRRLFVVLAVLLVPFCALPSSAASPMLVVYPFVVEGSAPQDLSTLVPNQIAAEITGLGGITIVHGAASAKPADYSRAARAAGAELYFSGSIVAVFGTSFSVLEQLVSTQSGLVRWSVTTHFRTLDDLRGDGGQVRSVILAGEPSPPPGIAAAGASLVTPSPGSSASPAAGGPLVSPPPMSGFAVLPVTGSALDSDRQYAVRALVDALQHRGFTAVTLTGSGAVDPVVDGPAECTTTGAQTLIAGTLDTTRVDSSATPPQTTAHVSLRSYDCRTHAFAAQATVVNHIAPIANDAIRGAAEDAVSAFPAPS
jgi:hypothetical protein